MKKSLLVVVFSIAASLSITVYAQPAKVPAEVIEDGFSDAANAYLKKHPEIEKCANKMAEASNKDRTRQGLEERTTYAEYGEFIGVCAEKSSGGSSAGNMVAVPKIDGTCVWNKPTPDNIIKSAGLKPKSIQIHGPEEGAGETGCAYGQTPKPGTAVKKGSIVKYKMWFEAG